MELLVNAMIRAFQQANNAHVALTNRGLPLEHLRALGGKEFSGIRGADPTKAEYWLGGVEKILE